MNRICEDLWTKIKTTFGALPDSTVRSEAGVIVTTGDILATGANWEGVLEEKKDIIHLLRSQGDPVLAPEISLVRQIIQDTITSRVTLSNHSIS
jgi:hypothetical protein